MLVAANRARRGLGSVPDFVFASLGLAGLNLWPVQPPSEAPADPWALAGPGGCGRRGAVALLAWSGTKLTMAGGQVGLAERSWCAQANGRGRGPPLPCRQAPSGGAVTRPATLGHRGCGGAEQQTGHRLRHAADLYCDLATSEKTDEKVARKRRRA